MKPSNVIYIGVSAINSGKRSGKDTFADFAIEYIKNKGNYNVIAFKDSFAEPLKRICEILGLDYNKLNGTEEEKESLTDWDWPQNNTYKKTGKMTYREVAQYIGSDLFRNQFHKDIWVKVADKCISKKIKNMYLSDLASYSGSDYFPYKDVPEENDKNATYIVFLPDVRFPNEAEILDYLVDIDRTNIRKIENDQHLSEQAGKLININDIDMRVFNWSNLGFLERTAKRFVDELLIENDKISLRKLGYVEIKDINN